MYKTQSKYDYSISILRIISMLFIVTCHVASHFELTPIAQFFNVGVPIFFLISGYLYGSREFHGSFTWFKKRLIRLYMPLLAWTVVVTVSSVIRQKDYLEWYHYIFLLFNLQGTNFILTTIPDVFRGPWFFTNIMFCYLALWLFSAIEEKKPNINRMFTYGGVFPYITFAVLAMLGISTDGLLIFFIGFVLARRGYLEQENKQNWFIAAIIFIISVLIRLVTKHFIDGTRLYDEVLVPTTHIGIACSILVFVKWFAYKHTEFIRKVADNAVSRYLDKTSIYTYICHDWFIDGTILAVLDLGLAVWIKVPLFCISIIAMSGLLFFVFENIGKLITNVRGTKET